MSVVEENLPAPVESERIGDRLERLGFKAAVKTLSQMERMRVAYEEYMFVTPATVAKFNEKLKKETLEEDKRAYHFKQLVFEEIALTSKIPPPSILDKLEKVQKTGIFDKFVVGSIKWIEQIKDPILFGRIEGCEDYFYIGQWDEDVKIEDLVFQQLR